MANIALYKPDEPSHINIETNLKRAAYLISQATSLFICTGAGLSVDSGIPDYRGPGEENGKKKSRWGSDPEIEKLYNITTEQKSEAAWWIKDPTAAWGHEINFIKLMTKCQPHGGYHSLQRLCNTRFPKSHFVLTTNIDAMHLRSGLNEDLYYPTYGSIFHGRDMSTIRTQCSYFGDIRFGQNKTCQGDVNAGIRSDIKWDTIHVDDTNGRANINTIPKCTRCHRPSRINCLMFEDKWCNTAYITGQNVPYRSNMMKFLKKYSGKEKTNIIVLEIGAGNHITTMRQRANKVIRDTIRAGGTATLIRLNLYQSLPEKTEGSRYF